MAGAFLLAISGALLIRVPSNASWVEVIEESNGAERVLDTVAEQLVAGDAAVRERIGGLADLGLGAIPGAEDTGSLGIRCVGAASGVGVPNVPFEVVRLFHGRGIAPAARIRTDSDGEATLLLVEGDYALRATRSPWGKVRVVRRFSVTHTVRVAENVVKGLVRSERDGRPVSGATIWCSYHAASEAGEAVGVTDHQGRFELAGIGGQHFLWSRVAGAPASDRYRVCGANVVEGDLIITQPDRVVGAVAGSVKTADGRPISGASVWVGNKIPSMASGPFPERYGGCESGVTDDGGRFEIPVVVRGDGDPISVIAKGYCVYVARLTWRGVRAQPQNDRGVQLQKSFDMILKPEWGVAGVVVGDGGEVISHCVLEWGDLVTFDYVRTVSDAGGRFDMSGIDVERRPNIIIRYWDPKLGKWASSVVDLRTQGSLASMRIVVGQ